MGLVAVHAQFGVVGQDDLHRGAEEPGADGFEIGEAEAAGEEFEQGGEANQSGQFPGMFASVRGRVPQFPICLNNPGLNQHQIPPRNLHPLQFGKRALRAGKPGLHQFRRDKSVNHDPVMIGAALFQPVVNHGSSDKRNIGGGDDEVLYGWVDLL